MRLCAHGTRVGAWCSTCGGVVKPSKGELAAQHRLNAPLHCNCEICQPLNEKADATENSPRR